MSLLQQKPVYYQILFLAHKWFSSLASQDKQRIHK